MSRPTSGAKPDVQPVSYAVTPKVGGSQGGRSTDKQRRASRNQAPPHTFHPGSSRYIQVFYPTANRTESHVSYLSVKQAEFKHDVAVFKTKHTAFRLAHHSTGTPVMIKWGTDAHRVQTFFGYINHAQIHYNHNKGQEIEVTCVGASWHMKHERQKTFRQMTDSNIARHIIHEHKLRGDIQPTKRKRSLNVHGHTSWEILVKLAKESGYTLYCHQHVVHFHSPQRDMKTKWKQAPQFWVANLAQTYTKKVNVFGFHPLYDESGEVGGRGSHDSYSIDKMSGQVIHKFDRGTENHRQRANVPQANKKHQRGHIMGLGKLNNPYFMKVQTHTAPNAAEAAHKLEGKVLGSLWHYRADAHTHGNVKVHQGMPVYFHSRDEHSQGLWYVSAVEHVVDSHGYQMYMHLGRDSLGDAYGTPPARPIVDTNPPSVVTPGTNTGIGDPSGGDNNPTVGGDPSNEPPVLSTGDLGGGTWQAPSAPAPTSAFVNSVYGQTIGGNAIRLPDWVLKRFRNRDP